MLAYFDCFSGISGDMTLGALIDLGVPSEWLKETLCKILPANFDISVSTISRSGINAKKVEVLFEDDLTSRDYKQIKSIIKSSSLSSNVKNKCLEIFERLASAESEIHGCPKEDVHFHEVGSIDAIVDIVGTVLCLDYLDIEKVIASEIPLGKGFVSCRHGTLPLPSPATLSILKGIPVYGLDIEHELVTPTGAAIITAVAESFQKMPKMKVEKIGYGAGERNLKSIPNLLRVVFGTLTDLQAGYQGNHQKEVVVVVETCIDDMNPEFFGFLMDRLFEDGAFDVYWIPVFMKKSRPGTMVQVLCPGNRRDAVINRILSETTSSGVRYYDVRRSILSREHISVDTVYGKVKVKRMKDFNGNIRIAPEYEVCKKIAIKKNIPLRVVYDTITKEAKAD